MIVLQELTPEQWCRVVDLFPPGRCDIYTTPYYYNTWENIEPGTKICLSGSIGNVVFLYAFFIRPIDGYALSEQYYDVVTAYGYGGLFTTGDITENELFQIDEAIKSWMINHNVVAEFIREHPSLSVSFPSAERVRVRTNVFATTIDAGVAWANFQTNARNHIRRAQKNGLTVEYDEKMNTIEQFYELYSRKAAHDNWDDFYHFPKGYFVAVKKELEAKGAIVRVMLDQQLVASSIVLFWPRVLHNHLAAADVNYKKLNANDLLYWGMVQYAVNRGCTLFSMGGGLTAEPTDPLFTFKKKFGNIYKPVFIGRRVHNSTVYQSLVTQWQQRYPEFGHKSKLLLCYRERS